MAASVLEVTTLRANLWQAGFRPIPIYSVEAGGPSPGKRPLGAQWQIDARADPPFCATHPAVPHATNTGILCDGLRAIDLDIDDRGKAKACSTLLVKMLGKAPARWRNNSPRVLALYRAAEGEPAKLSLTGRGHTKDCACKIEVLGRGQQFVAFGMHESGASLEWLPTQPGQEEYEDLTPVTEEQVLGFLTEAAKIIDAPPPALFGKGPVLFGRGPALNGANGHDTSVTTILLNPRRAMFEQIKVSQGGWHDLTRDWVAKMIARGYEPWAIEAMATSLTRPGYTLEQTQTQIRVFIEGAVGKGWAPGESPIIDGEISLPGDEPQPWRAIHLPKLEGCPVPERRWIVPHWLPVKVVTLFYADGGVGKTLLSLQLMAAASLDRRARWCGLPVEPVRSLGLFSEDDADELHIRMDAVRQHYEASWGELEKMCPVDAVGQDNILVRFDSRNGKMMLTPRFAQLRERALDTQTRVIVLDTAATCFGGNENDRSQVTQFVGGALTALAREIDGSVLLNAHPSVSGLTNGDLRSGSTAWNNSCRSRWTLLRPEDADGNPVLDSPERILTRRKANMATSGEAITMEWKDGVFYVPVRFSASVADRKDHVEIAFLQALEIRKQAGMHVSSNARAGNFAPKVLYNTPETKDYNLRELNEAMSNLLRRGVIKNQMYSRNHQTHEEIVRA